MFRLIVALLAIVAVEGFMPATPSFGVRSPAVVSLRMSDVIKEPSDGDESDAKIVNSGADIPPPIATGSVEGQIPGQDKTKKGAMTMNKMAKPDGDDEEE